MSSGKTQQGFTYLAALFLVAVAGLGLAAVGETWSHARQREKEAELIWIGNQYKQAIGLYYHRTPGALNRYPEKLEDLLEDRRQLSMQRYLRRIYADPITGKSDWGLVPAPDGGFMGIYSKAGEKPIRTVSVLSVDNAPAKSASYRDWQFTYLPPATASPRQAPAKR